MTDDPLLDNQLNLKLNSDNCISDNITIHHLNSEQQSHNKHSINLIKVNSSKSSHTIAKDLFKVEKHSTKNDNIKHAETSDFWTKEEDEKLIYNKNKIKNISWIKI